MKILRRYFFTGLVIILPVIATIWILTFLFTLLPAVPENLSNRIIGETQIKWLPDILFRLIVLIAFVIIVTIVGAFTSRTIGARITRFFQAILERIPLISRVYKALQQITTALFGPGKQVFRRVGLIQYPREGLYTLAFITNDTEKRLETTINTAFDITPTREEETMYVNLFVPTTPNPTSGFFIMVARKDVRILDTSVEDALKLIISGGAVQLDDIEQENVDGSSLVGTTDRE